MKLNTSQLVRISQWIDNGCAKQSITQFMKLHSRENQNSWRSIIYIWIGRKVIDNRSDDELETILKRYDTYMKTTRPVLDFYSQNANFHEIDGTQEIAEITRKIDAFINV